MGNGKGERVSGGVRGYGWILVFFWFSSVFLMRFFGILIRFLCFKGLGFILI